MSILKEAKTHLNRVARKLLQLSPEDFRYAITRTHLNINHNPDSDLTIKVAETKEELKAAYKIIHDSYVEIGYMDPHRSKMRLSFYNMLPHTSTLVALWQGEVVGTMSIVLDSPVGLPIDADFDTTHIRKSSFRLCEIIGLSIKKEFRSYGGKILFPIMKHMYHFINDNLGCDCVTVAVSPKRKDLYKGILLFSEIEDKVVNDAFIKGAKSVALYLDLKNVDERYKEIYDKRDDKINLYKYMFETTLPNLIFPEDEYHHVSHSSLSKDLLTYFFSEQSDVITSLSDDIRETFAKHIFPNDDLKSLLNLKDINVDDEMRQSMRFPTYCRGSVVTSNETSAITVLDVSVEGLRMITTAQLERHKKYTVNVEVSPQKCLSLEAVMQWNQKKSMYGFEIVEESLQWHEYIYFLEENYYKK
ncbi:MAG: hypothetical protein ACI9E5_000992 [Candidatus Omnitrophota bacterium]|jgi:hypothetical protein